MARSDVVGGEDTRNLRDDPSLPLLNPGGGELSSKGVGTGLRSP